jgi:hypothetical protein
MKTNQNGNYGRKTIVKPKDKLRIHQGILELKNAGMYHIDNFLSKFKYYTTSTFNHADNLILIQLNDLIFKGNTFAEVNEDEQKKYPEVFDLQKKLVDCKMKSLAQ